MNVIFAAYICTHIVSLLPQADWLRQRGINAAFYLASKNCVRQTMPTIVSALAIPC